MRNSKFVIYFSLCLITLVSCGRARKYDGYSYNEKYEYYYKLISFGDSFKEAHNTDIVSVSIAFSHTYSDSVVCFSDFDVVIDDSDSLCLSLLLKNVHTGDNLSYIVSPKNFLFDTLYDEMHSLYNDDEIQIDVIVNSVLDSSSYLQHQKEISLWKQTKEEYENFLIKKYIKQRKVKFQRLNTGIYKRILKKGRGKSPKTNDLLTITYQGSTLNGEIINHFTTMDFTYGSQWQVIEGIEKVLKTMKKGERAQVIIPSKYAWGEVGSSDGSIKPYTTIIFDIEIKNIK